MESWKRIDKKDLEPIINAINKEEGFDLYSLETSSAKQAAMPFYKTLSMLEITDFASIPPLTMRFFINNSNAASSILKLDGSKEALLEINKVERPTLDESNIVAYAKFALGTVMGEEGTFRLVENMGDIEYSRDPSEKEQKMLLAVIKPARIAKVDDGYSLDANVLYSDCVYRAIISVTSDGTVDIQEEKTMLNDMPTRQIMLL
ncbi:MAG: hypothetical protein AB7U85_04280 [Alphaproteobacteria bacterium]